MENIDCVEVIKDVNERRSEAEMRDEELANLEGCTEIFKHSLKLAETFGGEDEETLKGKKKGEYFIFQNPSKNQFEAFAGWFQCIAKKSCSQEYKEMEECVLNSGDVKRCNSFARKLVECAAWNSQRFKFSFESF